MTRLPADQSARPLPSARATCAGRLARSLAAAILFLGLAAVASPSEAETFQFSASGGCSEGCSAYATITPGDGMLTITLTDTQADPASAGDILSGIDFTIDGLPGSVSLASQSASLVSVGSDGVASAVSGQLDHWGVGVSGKSIVLETAGSYAAGGKPIDMILGPAGLSGTYTGNASVANGHFSPYANGSATFVVMDSMVTSWTTVASVDFHFGTSPDTILLGHAVATGGGSTNAPEPTSLAIFAVALAGAAYPLARRRSRRA
jgi:MYXO-CTERM domain-containing protein